MKRTILFITVIFLALSINAQTARSTTISRVGSNVSFTGTVKDSMSTNQAWYHSFNLGAKNSRQGYDLLVKLDSVSGTPTLSVFTGTSQDGGTTFVPIDTITWAGTTSDTSFVIKDVATGILSKQFIIKSTTTAGVGKVDQILGKIGDL